MQFKYIATFSIFLPEETGDLPFYNIVCVVGSDTLGSSFAFDIAKKLLQDFKPLWKAEDFLKIEKFLTPKGLRSITKADIKNAQKSDEVVSDVESIAITAIHIFLDEIEKVLVTKKPQ